MSLKTAIYYDREYRENADIEICVPIKKLIDSVNVNSKIIKGVKGISTIHNGEYSKLNLAYKAIFDYANENNIKCDIPTREFYKKGPGMIFKGNPEKYITEIFLPIEE